MNTMVIVALLVIKHDVDYLHSVCNAVYLHFTLLKHLLCRERNITKQIISAWYIH